jgi:fructose-specific phosphotransferase system component IIB
LKVVKLSHTQIWYSKKWINSLEKLFSKGNLSVSIITGLSGLPASAAWKILVKDPAKQIDKFAKNKDVQRDIDYFKKNIGKFETVEDLLKDRRATRVLLSAYGLQDEAINGLGRIKKVLTEDPTSDNALSRKLADSRFAAMAKDLRLDQGMDNLKSSSFIAKLEQKYIQNEFEIALGNIDPTLRQAAYFARNITNANEVYGILGDKVLREVVTAALNLPKQLALQPVDTQARAITSRLKIDQFGTSIAQNLISSSQVSRSKEDITIIENNLKISDAALKQINTLQTSLQKSLDSYDAYASRVYNPAEIATQQEAVPELLRYEQLLNAGGRAITTVHDNVQKLQELTEALNSLKTQFNNLVSTIKSQLNNANIIPPTTYDGTTPPTENIFQFGSDGTLSVSINAAGTDNASMSVYDTSNLVSFLDNANASFTAMTSHTDNGSLGAAMNQLNSAFTRSSTIKSTITSDIANVKDKMDNPDYGLTMNSDEIIRGKRSLDDALIRSKQVEILLNQISTLAGESAGRVTGADRSDLVTKFETLRTQVNDLINTPSDPSLDNLLTTDGLTSYNMLTRPAGGGSEDVLTYVRGAKNSMDDIINGLAAADISTKSGADDLSIRALQLTNRTDSALRTLSVDQGNLDSVLNRYDTKGRIDNTLYDLKRDLDSLIAGAAVGNSNLLSVDQSAINVSISSSTSLLRLNPATTFRSDVLAGLNNALSQIGNGLSATRQAVSQLTDIVDRTRRNMSSDNRNLSFEQGKIGAVLDMMEPDKASDGSSIYKTNSFTEKFIMRFLTLNGSSGPVFSASQASVLNLLSGSMGGGMMGNNSSPFNSILSLSMSV